MNKEKTLAEIGSCNSLDTSNLRGAINVANNDLSHLNAGLRGMLINVRGEAPECVGENALAPATLAPATLESAWHELVRNINEAQRNLEELRDKLGI